jgi:hypothetical protein
MFVGETLDALAFVVAHVTPIRVGAIVVHACQNLDGHAGFARIAHACDVAFGSILFVYGIDDSTFGVTYFLQAIPGLLTCGGVTFLDLHDSAGALKTLPVFTLCLRARTVFVYDAAVSRTGVGHDRGLER